MWYIYRIYSDLGPLQYYGSTTNIKRRWSEHKCSKDTNSKIVFETYGSNCKYEILEEGEDNTRIERERFYIENNECVNKQIAGRTRKERIKSNKETMKEYMKIYYESNKETIKEHMKTYRKSNKEARQIYDKAYYQANKESKKCKRTKLLKAFPSQEEVLIASEP
jgi:hypothetical protein